jgi:hypothetical protein
VIAAVLLAAITATVPPKLDGIAIGQNVATVIKDREIPIDRENPMVTNTDSGHVWTWTQKDETLERITTDDDGVVQMIDILASSANRQTITVPVARSLQFNESSHVNANFAADGINPDLFADEWLPLANRAGTVLGYAIQPNYGVLFAFPAPGDQGMIEVLYGTREALFDTGMIPSEGSSKAMVTPQLQPATRNRGVYKRPKLVQWPPCGGFIRNQVVFVRVTVGADGIPSAAAVFAGSGGALLDAHALYCPMHSKFEAATLDGKPVPSVVFQRRVV